MRTTIQQLAEFLTVCRGNWRNACFISCNECKCHSPCSGYLMSADADGKPVLIPAAEYERLTAQRIDPMECRGNLSRSAFEDIYALYLKLTRGLSFTSRRTLDDCIDRLVTRGLVAEGRGSSEYEALYDDELTTSENLPILMAASRQARPVSAAIANLYLHKQIVFERC